MAGRSQHRKAARLDDRTGRLNPPLRRLEANIVDELDLMIEPITLGGGKSIFPADGNARQFDLVSATTAKTGVLICRYQRAR